MRMKITLALALLSVMFIAGCSSGGSSYTKAQLEGLATCLADNNVREYGAFWCPNCAKQEELFGSGHKIMRDRGVYVECDPRCTRNDDGELPKACRDIEGKAEECLAKKVDRYPTWDFPNGERLIGVQEIAIIASNAGCSL